MNTYMQHRLALKLGIAVPVAKTKKPIANESEKKKQQKKDEKPQRDLQLEWYKYQVSKMKGKCIECGGPINIHVFAFAVNAAAHALAKRKGQFPSVALHKDNCLELCAENGCHGRYDSTWEDAAQMKCWPVALAKIIKICPSIAASERMHLPDIIRQEIEL